MCTAGASDLPCTRPDWRRARRTYRGRVQYMYMHTHSSLPSVHPRLICVHSAPGRFSYCFPDLCDQYCNTNPPQIAAKRDVCSCSWLLKYGKLGNTTGSRIIYYQTKQGGPLGNVRHVSCSLCYESRTESPRNLHVRCGRRHGLITCLSRLKNDDDWPL